MQSRRVYSSPKLFSAVLVPFLIVTALASQPARAENYKFKVLHTFHGAPNDGQNPLGVLVRDSDGNLYGTTNSGGKGRGPCGSSGCGTVFKMNKSGKLVWLHSLSFPNGAGPMAGVLRDKSGNLFGTTTFGGSGCSGSGCGVVFKLDADGKGTALYKFNANLGGYYPEALLVADEDGNLYGTTYEGGTYDLGTVFKVDKFGDETVLHSFAGPVGGGGEGAYAYSGVIRDAAGNLYGVTGAGGADGEGAAYKLDAMHGETLLYSFEGSDGIGPDSVLVADGAGNLYGTTSGGGNSECGGTGCGVVFELSPQSGGNWAETVLYTFCSLSSCADGREPLDGPLVLDAAGNLYGTTHEGGASSNCNGAGCGVVFKLDPSGKETVLHSFTEGADGAFPWVGLTMDAAGNLYGVTAAGGDMNCSPPEGCGVVFKITPLTEERAKSLSFVSLLFARVASAPAQYVSSLLRMC
jgi:uncharacterized repeat protein (TIGR03803 family)